MNTKLWF